MATIKVRSGLAHFHLIDSIQCVDAGNIEGLSCLENMPTFCVVEAMAQLAALHVRFRTEFRRHAFLLKIVRCRGRSWGIMDGTCRCKAQLKGHSVNAFRYYVTAESKMGSLSAGELLIGVRDYDERFQQGLLQGHYQKLFAGLCTKAMGRVIPTAFVE